MGGEELDIVFKVIDSGGMQEGRCQCEEMSLSRLEKGGEERK